MQLRPDAKTIALLRDQISKEWKPELPTDNLFEAGFEHLDIKQYMMRNPARKIDLNHPVIFSEMPLFGILNEKGSLYYLQSYLLYALDFTEIGPADTMANHLPSLFLIMRLNAKNGKQYLKSLSKRQREIIAEFLRIVSCHAEFFGVTDMKRPLQTSIDRWNRFAIHANS